MLSCKLSCKFVKLGIKWAKVKYNEGNFRVTVELGMLWVSVRLTVKEYCGLNFKISNKDKNAMGNCRVSC